MTTKTRQTLLSSLTSLNTHQISLLTTWLILCWVIINPASTTKTSSCNDTMMRLLACGTYPVEMTFFLDPHHPTVNRFFFVGNSCSSGAFALRIDANALLRRLSRRSSFGWSSYMLRWYDDAIIGLCYYSVEMYITSLLCCCWQQFCLFSFAIDHHAMRIFVGGGSSRVAFFSLSIRACVAIRPFWPRRLIYIAINFKKKSKMAGRRDYLTKLI